MIDRDRDLPLTRQAAVLNISRGGLYYKPRPVSAADLARSCGRARGVGGIQPAVDRFHPHPPHQRSHWTRDSASKRWRRR
jgi:hypothetical protein